MSSPAAPVQPPPPRAVRFGVLGCADIARKVSRAMLMLPPGAATIAAVGSRSDDKARRFISEIGFPAARVHGSYESLLEDPDVEAVYLPLPTSLHVPWATAVAARGKHLLLEKPTALCTAELDAILGACDASGVQFMDTTMWIHNPRTAKMREIVSDKDAFGDVRVVRSWNGFFVADVRWNLEMPRSFSLFIIPV
jgi:predicted dehydrogenase